MTIYSTWNKIQNSFSFLQAPSCSNPCFSCFISPLTGLQTLIFLSLLGTPQILFSLGPCVYIGSFAWAVIPELSLSSKLPSSKSLFHGHHFHASSSSPSSHCHYSLSWYPVRFYSSHYNFVVVIHIICVFRFLLTKLYDLRGPSAALIVGIRKKEKQREKEVVEQKRAEKRNSHKIMGV